MHASLKKNASKPRGWGAFLLLVLPMVLVIYSSLVIGSLVISGPRLYLKR